jgi:hypothetical protein
MIYKYLWKSVHLIRHTELSHFEINLTQAGKYLCHPSIPQNEVHEAYLISVTPNGRNIDKATESHKS